MLTYASLIAAALGSWLVVLNTEMFLRQDRMHKAGYIYLYILLNIA